MSIFRGTEPRFSPEWVKKWGGSLTHFLRSAFSRQKRIKDLKSHDFRSFMVAAAGLEISGRPVMSCSEALIPCNARVSPLFYPRKSVKTRRPSEFAPRHKSGLSRKWVGIWGRADSGSSRNGTLNQRRAVISPPNSFYS